MRTGVLLLLAASLPALLGACSDNSGTPENRPSTAEAGATATPGEPATIENARESLRLGEFERAADEFGEVAERESEPGAKSEALLGSAVARFESGDRDGSVESLKAAADEAPDGSEMAWEAGYLLGRRQNEANEHDDARKTLEPLAEGANHPLRPFVLSEYATALSQAGDREGAERAWDEVLALPIPPSFRADIFRAKADAAEKAGDRAAQALWLDAYIEETGDASARLQRAEVAVQLGDQATFASTLQLLIARAPGSRAAPAALAALQQAGVEVDAGTAGLVYYRHGEYHRAIEVLEEALTYAVSPEAITFRTYYLAAAWEALGDFPNAIALYDQAAATGADSPFIHRSKWWAARLTEDLGETAAASTRYLGIVVEGPAGEFSEDAAFRAGYSLYRAGVPTGAITTWDAIGATTDTRLLYWRGRAYAATGDTAGASVQFQAAVAAGPLSFYGLESARQLGTPQHDDVSYSRLGDDTGVDWAALEGWLASFVANAPVTPTSTDAAASLMAVGLRDEAGDLLLDSGGGSEPWSLLDRLRQAHGLGLTETVIALAARLRMATEGGPAAPVDLMRLEYPLDYVALLEREGRVNDVDPLFMAAMIRQESLWNPSAGSIAGALGLSQVIPPTGEAIAEALDVDGFEPEDLFRPSIAIPFGAFYLGEQLAAYDAPYVALSAYNAGPGNAFRWQEANPGETPADFLEGVDFGETYRYVALVLEHYAHYNAAWR